ncbi:MULTISPECIES: radical SAM/SPASM domain-containing protein [unclassified Bradyrhizobium]|uniref:radical SAM/SPASM domain-containing protein n=1 Tax=unclassified Bradyrhizobium TaxID=2631580 RepID=UPI0028EF470B|nr:MULTISPECIES: radical SAM protein [unclassified Bradyrhizobium]
MVAGEWLTARSLRWRREEFGCIVARPDGDIDLYDHSVSRLLEQERIATTELDQHRLRGFTAVSEQFHLRHPLIVSIEISRACELKCPHCYIDGGDARANELSRGELFELVDDLHRCGVFCLQFIGGEPLEHPDFLDLLTYAHELGFVTSFVTNGLHLTDDVIARLPTRDFGMGLSIDGIESNALLRGSESRFEVIAERALKLKRAGVDFNIVLTLNKLNIKEAPRLIAWCRENDVMLETLETQMIGRARNAQGLQLSPLDVEDDLAVFVAKEELEDYYEECVDPRAKLYYAGFLQLAYWLDSLTARCKGARSIAYIASNGDVYPCSNCAGEEILSGGNVRLAPFSLLWAYSFQEMRDITFEKFDRCHGCELGHSQYSCSGKCPALSHALNRTYTDCGATPYTRAIVKARTHKYLEIHTQKSHGQMNPSRTIRVTR